MSSHDKEPNLVIGAVIGGVVGIGVLAIFLATRKSSNSPLHTIGKVIGHIGEIFEEQDIKEPARLKAMEKKLHKHEDTISDVVEFIATGINLWKKYKN